jgi:hypothetical protein
MQIARNSVAKYLVVETVAFMGSRRRNRNCRMLIGVLGVMVAIVSGQAVAADRARKKPVPPVEVSFAGCRETKDSVLPADVFGFGSGTDVADSGSLEAGLEYGRAYGRRSGSISVKVELAYNGLEPLALNGCAPETGSFGVWWRSSDLSLFSTDALKVVDLLLLGLELQHLRAPDGAFLNELAGQAWFAGPIFFWDLVPGRLSLPGTHAVRVGGKARGDPGKLDVSNFSQHVAKLKLGYAF